MDGLKQTPHRAIAEVRRQLLSKFRQDGHIPALATPGLGDEDHLLIGE
jgi:hypothetical protein